MQIYEMLIQCAVDSKCGADLTQLKEYLTMRHELAPAEAKGYAMTRAGCDLRYAEYHASQNGAHLIRGLLSRPRRPISHALTFHATLPSTHVRRAAAERGGHPVRQVPAGVGLWRELERGRVEVLAVAVHPGVFDVCAILARLSHTTSAARS